MTKSARPSKPIAQNEGVAPAPAAAPAPEAAPTPEAAPAEEVSSPASAYLEQLFAPLNAMTGMWNAWLQTAEVVSRERGLESSKLFNRLWDPELWWAGGLAPLLQEMQEAFSLPRFADLP